jgi:hypothetical protein
VFGCRLSIEAGTASETSPSTAAATALAFVAPKARSSAALASQMVCIPTVIARSGARLPSKSAALTRRVDSASRTTRVREPKGAWLVEADVAVAPDAEHGQIHASCLADGHLVALALGLRVGGGAVWNVDPRRIGVHEPVEVPFHVDVVARRMVGGEPEVLVQVEEGRPREGGPPSACSRARRLYMPRGVTPVGSSKTATGLARITSATISAAAALMAS